MNPGEKILDELLNTIEKGSQNNQVIITNVDLFLKSWRGEIELYKKESTIPKEQGIEIMQHEEPVCSKCQYKADGKIKAIFSTNKKKQRQVKQTSHCRKCDEPQMWFIQIFENFGEEEHRKILLKHCGIEIIEE